jgi:hypothetical protein
MSQNPRTTRQKQSTRSRTRRGVADGRKARIRTLRAMHSAERLTYLACTDERRQLLFSRSFSRRKVDEHDIETIMTTAEKADHMTGLPPWWTPLEMIFGVRPHMAARLGADLTLLWHFFGSTIYDATVLVDVSSATMHCSLRLEYYACGRPDYA